MDLTGFFCWFVGAFNVVMKREGEKKLYFGAFRSPRNKKAKPYQRMESMKVIEVPRVYSPDFPKLLLPSALRERRFLPNYRFRRNIEGRPTGYW